MHLLAVEDQVFVVSGQSPMTFVHRMRERPVFLEIRRGNSNVDEGQIYARARIDVDSSNVIVIRYYSHQRYFVSIFFENMPYIVRYSLVFHRR